MSKQATNLDAISIALKCDQKAGELHESLPTIAEAFREAATMLRLQHDALTRSQCPHVMSFTVTKEMIESGRESRDPGKYCMTCGERIEHARKKPQRKDNDKEGDGDDQNKNDQSA